MEPQLDPIPARASSRDQVNTLRQSQPDFYDPPARRRLPPMIATGLAFATAATLFFGAEAVLPPQFKPSHFVAPYEAELARAEAKGRAEGEFSSRIVYDRTAKLLEASANTLVETCKAQLSRSNELYKVIWDRANTGYRLYGEQYNANIAQRNRLAEATTGASQQAATLAELLGYAGMVAGGDDFSKKSFDFAEMARQRAYDVVAKAQAQGVPVSPAGWDVALPKPNELPAASSCNLPASLGASPPEDTQ